MISIITRQISCVSLGALAAIFFSLAATPPALAEHVETQVHCIEPHAACSEAQKVIDTLHEMAKAINRGDFEHFSEYFDENVTTFDDITKKLLVGKKAVVARIKERYENSVRDSESHAVSYTIFQPYAKVHDGGKTASVTCILRKVVGGKHPVVFESHDSKVFVKEGDQWKELHSQGQWKKISS